MDRELAAFFLQMFQVAVDRGELPNIRLPTFEEVLGLTDLAIMRKEAFRRFDVDGRDTSHLLKERAAFSTIPHVAC